MHVDFQEVVAGETMTLKCPIVYVGTPIGVRADGGIFDQILHELTIEALPANIPDHIDVDVSELHVGKSMHVSDLQMPAGVKAMDDETLTVCIVQPPKQAPTEPGEAAVAEPEVIRKAKADDE